MEERRALASRFLSSSSQLHCFISSLFSPLSYLPVEFRGRGRRRRNKGRCCGVEGAHGGLVSGLLWRRDGRRSEGFFSILLGLL